MEHIGQQPTSATTAGLVEKQQSKTEKPLHDPSERMEHFIDPALESQLRAQVEGETDPQGKKIPGG